MSNYNRKGYLAIKARDPKTHRIFTARVSTRSAIINIQRARQRKFEKLQAAGRREFKRQLRDAKKKLPLELRAKVNWNNLKKEVI